MKSRFVWIAEILLVILIFSIIVYFDYHIEKESSHVAAFGLTNDKVEHNPSNNNTVKSPSILINSTNTSNCIYPTLNERNSLNLDSSEKHIKNSDTNGSKRSAFNNVNINGVNAFCKVYTISDPSKCTIYYVNYSKKSCDIDKENSEDTELEPDNFDSDGLLLADTKFNNQYTFETIDPVNPNNKIKVSLDLDGHSQGDLDNLNSPRIELVRENLEGEPDMSAAKNQIIKWQGAIDAYFEEPTNDFDNETYITIQFNTGRHTSDEDDQRNGFGVMFDVSACSNPDLFEFREDGHYVKYDYEMIKQLAGDSFKFHSIKDNGNPIFINNLLKTDHVTLKVVTYLDSNNSRIVKTFIDNGQGKEVPYWTISDLSKLKEYDKVDNDDDFIKTVMQGSGYVIARTDNINTSLLSFESLAF